MLETLRNWLESYPKWNAGGFTCIDFTDGTPGTTAMYPQGMEELERKADVTGNTWVRCRWNFLLYRIGQRQEDSAVDAAWLMEFQQWVQQQCAGGQAPVFGDAPDQELLYARKGRQQKANAAGAVSYSVELVAEFMKYYGQ